MLDAERNRVFESWIDAHKTILFKVARVYGATHSDREDLFQEIALEVWHSVKAYRVDCAATTWIYRVALNTALAWRRKERKHSVEGTITKVDDGRLRGSMMRSRDEIGQLTAPAAGETDPRPEPGCGRLKVASGVTIRVERSRAHASNDPDDRRSLRIDFDGGGPAAFSTSI